MTLLGSLSSHALRRAGELLGEWRVDGPEVHGRTRSRDGRIRIGDASRNQVLVVRD